MFTEYFEQALRSHERTWHTMNHASYPFWIFVISAALYSTWRAWTFTIDPAMHPNEPKKLPYHIPIIGHAISFFLDYHGTLAYGRKYFDYTEEPHMVAMLGQNLCLMSSPHQISEIYRNTVELTYDTFIREVLTSLGASSSAVDKWIPLPLAKDVVVPAADSFDSVSGDLTHIGQKLCQRQLLPGEELEIVQKGFMERINNSLMWENIPDSITNRSIPEVKSISLLYWCQDVLLKPATCAFFGERLLQVDPNLIEDFLIFDDASWKLHFGYPRLLSYNMYSAKNRIVKTITTYLKLAKEERLDASFLVKNLEVEMKKMGIEEKDMAALLMAIYWVINANAYKQCFWMMVYILNDPAVLSKLRDEIDPVVSAGTKKLETRLEQDCPRLKAIYQETLRLTASTSTIRGVQSTTRVGDKFLQAGTKILIPYRLLHLNPQVFGKNAEEFNAERFLETKDLSKNPSFRPFGGGKTHCPGRFLAQREVFTFVALTLCRFDIDIKAVKHGGRSIARGSSWKTPRMDSKKLSLAIMDPVKGDDLIVNVTRREQRELSAV